MVVGIVVLPFYLLVVIIIIIIRIVIYFFPHLVRYQLIVDEIDRLKKTRLLNGRFLLVCAVEGDLTLKPPPPS